MLDSLSSLNGFGMLTTIEEMAFDNVEEEGTAVIHHELAEEDDGWVICAELLLLDGNFVDGDDDIQSVAESTVCQALFIQDDDDSRVVVSVFNSSTSIFCRGGCFSCF